MLHWKTCVSLSQNKSRLTAVARRDKCIQEHDNPVLSRASGKRMLCKQRGREPKKLPSTRPTDQAPITSYGESRKSQTDSKHARRQLTAWHPHPSQGLPSWFKHPSSHLVLRTSWCSCLALQSSDTFRVQPGPASRWRQGPPGWGWGGTGAERGCFPTAALPPAALGWPLPAPRASLTGQIPLWLPGGRRRPTAGRAGPGLPDHNAPWGTKGPPGADSACAPPTFPWRHERSVGITLAFGAPLYLPGSREAALGYRRRIAESSLSRFLPRPGRSGARWETAGGRRGGGGEPPCSPAAAGESRLGRWGGASNARRRRQRRSWEDAPVTGAAPPLRPGGGGAGGRVRGSVRLRGGVATATAGRLGPPRAAPAARGARRGATVIARPLASRLLSQATATAAVLCGRSCLACPVPSRVPVLVTGAGKGYAEFVPASGASGGGKAPKTGRRLEGDVASVADVRPLLEKSNIFIRVCIYLIAVKLLWSSLPGESPCKVSSGSCNANALCFDFRVHPIKYWVSVSRKYQTLL